MDNASVRQWLDKYKRSWEEQDTNLLVSLFTSDASYHPTPFTEPFRGTQELRKLWDTIKTRQADNHIELDLWHVAPDRAVIQWTGRTTQIKSNNKKREGNGIFLLLFNADGKCRQLMEWQHWHEAGAPLVVVGLEDSPDD
jgi:hypothetical protein